MSLRLTARYRARLAAMRRIRQILAEQAELLAQYPDLRADPKRPGVVANDNSPTEARQTQDPAFGSGSRADQASLTSQPTKKYFVF